MSSGNTTHSVWTIKSEKKTFQIVKTATCYTSNNFTFFQELKQNKFTPNDTYMSCILTQVVSMCTYTKLYRFILIMYVNSIIY